jgi:hypothetical protein
MLIFRLEGCKLQYLSVKEAVENILMAGGDAYNDVCVERHVMESKLNEFGIRHVTALRTVIEGAEQIQTSQKKIDQAHAAGYDMVNIEITMLCTVEKAEQMMRGEQEKLRASIHEVARLELGERGLDPNSFQWHVQLRNTVNNVKEDLATSFPLLKWRERKQMH